MDIDMDQQTREWVIDYLNLLLGKGEESAEFWENMLLPQTSRYFSFHIEELRKH